MPRVVPAVPCTAQWGAGCNCDVPSQHRTCCGAGEGAGGGIWGCHTRTPAPHPWLCHLPWAQPHFSRQEGQEEGRSGRGEARG